MKRSAMPKRRTPMPRRMKPMPKRRLTPRRKEAPNVHAKVRPLSASERAQTIDADGWCCQGCGEDIAERQARLDAAIAMRRRDARWLAQTPEGRRSSIARDAGVLVVEARDRLDGKTIAQVDHATQRAQRGGNEGANRQTLCRPCHIEKSGAEQGQLSRLPSHRKAQ